MIIGENNVGKSNLLDYIYERNRDWDKFEVSDENYREEESEKGPVFGYRYSYSLYELFYSDSSYFPYLFHSSNPRVKSKPIEGKIKFSYKIYYFDLKTSTSFLTEPGRQRLQLQKTKFRSFQVFYGRWDEGKKTTTNYLTKYFAIESEEKPNEEIKPWKPDFNDEKNFIKYIEGDEEIYHGYNKSVSHPLDKLGSGYLKIEAIKSLIEDLKNEPQSPNEREYYYAPRLDNPDEYEEKRRFYSSFFHTPILLIDEPEVFLHPSLISELANTIKKAKEKNVTVILTTHSPSFLSHFIHENEKTDIAIIKKEENRENEGNLKPIFYFYDWIEKEENIKKITNEWMSYCQCFRKKKEKGITEALKSLYYNQWKVILNERNLKVFFSKKIIFVEGMSDYILLTSEKIKKKVEIEIIPIFGKTNYIFFKELAEKLDLNYWFLLDLDKNRIDEEKFPKDFEPESESEPTNCLHKETHTRFWYKHQGELKNINEIKENTIIHSIESKISWFPENMENFLIPEKKEDIDKEIEWWVKHRWSKESRIINNITFNSLNQERISELVKSLEKIINLVESKSSLK